MYLMKRHVQGGLKMRVSNTEFQTIRNWIYRNARPLDLARWKYHFEEGSREEVINVLSAYQNPDGGFGNGIEADSWNKNSSPISTGTVIEILKEIGFADQKHFMIREMLRYFDETLDFVGDYWLSSTITNNDYPHAPWWTHPNNVSYDWGYNPTAMIAGFVIGFADHHTSLYKKAEKIAMAAVEKYLNGVMENGAAYDSVKREGELKCLHYLAESLETSNWIQEEKIIQLKDRLIERLDLYIEKDASKWTGYCCRPSMLIASPDSMFYKGNEAIVDEELAFLLKNRNQDGVWDITWNWGVYEKQFAISENWWKAHLAILNVLLLKNFEKLKRT
jgi:AraC-like DNA-binding protein